MSDRTTTEAMLGGFLVGIVLYIVGVPESWALVAMFVSGLIYMAVLKSIRHK